jgi:hypothetical protein
MAPKLEHLGVLQFWKGQSDKKLSETKTADSLSSGKVGKSISHIKWKKSSYKYIQYDTISSKNICVYEHIRFMDINA